MSGPSRNAREEIGLDNYSYLVLRIAQQQFLLCL